jgi:hypothetical protein
MTFVPHAAVAFRDQDPAGWSVSVKWSSTDPASAPDRTDGSGWLVNTKALADRLARAVNAGVVFYEPGLHTDVNGKTFVHAASRVLGRMANADLRRLGY